METRVLLYFSFMAILFMIIIPFGMNMIDADDELLKEIPLAKPLLGYAVNERFIESNNIDVGLFEDSHRVDVGFFEDAATQVKTSKGVFVVRGNVNGIKGFNVTIKGTNDERLANQLCIADDCYNLLNYKTKKTV